MATNNKSCSFSGAHKPKIRGQYQNVVSAVYTNVINGLIEPLQEEFAAAGCDVSTLHALCDTWYDKIKTTKAVESFLTPEFHKRGTLSASERAKAIAKRDMEVAYERMSCTNVQLVGEGPRTNPVITARGNIVHRRKSDVGNDIQMNVCAPNDKAEWNYPPEALFAEPSSLVLFTLNVPVRSVRNSALQMRKFNVRLPASLAQHSKLDSLVDKQMLDHLTSMSMSSASAVLQGHIQTQLTLEKYKSKRIRLAHQLDGNFSDSDDCFDINDPFGLRQLSDDVLSSSDESGSDTHPIDKKPKRLNAKSKAYLRRLFHLCTSSSSSENELYVAKTIQNKSENESSLEKKNKVNTNSKKIKPQISNQMSESCEIDNDHLLETADLRKPDTLSTPEKSSAVHTNLINKNLELGSVNHDLASKSEKLISKQKKKNTCLDESAKVDNLDETMLNSGDELSSLESNEETENVCICLFDQVRRRKSKWRMQLRSGIMNIRGGDYAFDSMDVQTVW